MASQEPRAGLPLTWESKAPGFARRSWIKISQVRTLSVESSGKKLNHASEEKMARVIEGLNEIVFE